MDLTENIEKDAMIRYKNELGEPSLVYNMNAHRRWAYIQGRKDERKLRESQNHETSDEALHIGDVVGQSEQLPPQICYKMNEPCKHNCSGLCKESC